MAKLKKTITLNKRRPVHSLHKPKQPVKAKTKLNQKKSDKSLSKFQKDSHKIKDKKPAFKKRSDKNKNHDSDSDSDNKSDESDFEIAEEHHAKQNQSKVTGFEIKKKNCCTVVEIIFEHSFRLNLSLV